MSPTAALLLLTAGTLLIYLEFNRPGLILPGAAGLTLALIAISRLIHQGAFPPSNLAVCLLGFVLLAASTRTRTHLAHGVLATICFLYGFGGTASAHPRSLVTISCALFLGVGTSFLTTIAARARQNKGLDLK